MQFSIPLPMHKKIELYNWTKKYIDGFNELVKCHPEW